MTLPTEAEAERDLMVAADDRWPDGTIRLKEWDAALDRYRDVIRAEMPCSSYEVMQRGLESCADLPADEWDLCPACDAQRRLKG